MPVPHYQVINNFLTYTNLEELLQVFESVPEDRWVPGRQGTGYLKYEITHHTDELYFTYVLWALQYLGYISPGGNKKELRETDEHLSREGDGPRWDAWLMKMPDGAYIHPHTDPCPFDAGEHHRLNMCIRAAERGGRFSIEGEPVNVHTGEAILFRPDAMRHEVSMVSGADRLMISVGCVKEKR